MQTQLTLPRNQRWLNVSCVLETGAYFAVLIYSSDVGDGDCRVDFVEVAKINQV